MSSIQFNAPLIFHSSVPIRAIHVQVPAGRMKTRTTRVAQHSVLSSNTGYNDTRTERVSDSLRKKLEIDHGLESNIAIAIAVFSNVTVSHQP